MASSDAIAGGSNKKSKPRGLGHELRLDVLMNSNIKAEHGWEEVSTPYWSFRTCKRYVKMYHIGKLWPPECHVLHNKEYCFKPATCLNAHFVHRSMEVWRALFGHKPMSKGKINYSLACMVYAEIVLGRKVEWNTYPRTTAAPVQLPFYEKDIPDTFVSNVSPSKGQGTTQNVPEQVQSGVHTEKEDAEVMQVEQEGPFEFSEVEVPPRDVTTGTDIVLRTEDDGTKDIGGKNSVEGESSKMVTTQSPSANVHAEGIAKDGPTSSMGALPSVSITGKEIVVFKVPRLPEHSIVPLEKSEEEVPLEELQRATDTITHLVDSNAFTDITSMDAYEAANEGQSPSSSEMHTRLLLEAPPVHVAANDEEETPPPYFHPLLKLLDREDLERLRQIPPIQEMNNFLECTLRWKKIKIGPAGFAVSNEEGPSNETSSHEGGEGQSKAGFTEMEFKDMWKSALSLSCTARLVAECTPALEAIAESFSQITPQVMHGALAFRKFVEFAGELQDKRVDDLKNLCDLEEKLAGLTDLSALKEERDELKLRFAASQKDLQDRKEEYDRERLRNEKLKVENRQLTKDCETQRKKLREHREEVKKYKAVVSEVNEKTKEHERQYDVERLANIKLEDEITELTNANSKLEDENLELTKACTTYEAHLQEHRDMLQKSQNEKTCSQCKGLLEDGQWTEESDRLSLPLDKGKAADEITEVKVGEGASVQKEPLLELKGSKPTPTVEELKHQLDLAIQEKNEAESSMRRMENVGALGNILPKGSGDLRWMFWARQLQDPARVASRLMNGLLAYAMESDETYEHVSNSYLRMSKKLEDEKANPDVQVTVWGDMDRMFERLNHGKSYQSDDIDWTKETEEGWVVHNTLSAHILDEERTLVLGSTPNDFMLKGRCCLCQHGFGPEGGLTLGQCGHSFHILCIQRAATYAARCPMCRIPLTTRLFEMLGISLLMPSGHEYNRWNLPLDQAPFKFQNYLHWGKTMDWDSTNGIHGLINPEVTPKDQYFWMTRDVEVELRAFGIPMLESRELFCRSMGGHWSIEHGKFFRFPAKEWKKDETDGRFVMVPSDPEVNVEHDKYNHDLIGRALVLSKLEEAAKVRCRVDLDQILTQEHKMEDVARAFDRRMDDVITKWRDYLGGIDAGGELNLFHVKNEDQEIQKLLHAVDTAVSTLQACEVDLSRKNKRRMSEEDDHSPNTKRQFERVDMEVGASREIQSRIEQGGSSSAHPIPRRTSRRLMEREGAPRDAEDNNM